MTDVVGRSSTLRLMTLEVLLPIAVGAIGLMMAHHPMILSGLTTIQTDLGDSRLINYILEHSYLWVTRDAGHRAFWSPPFFFPASNIGAYSDVLLTVAPIYWGFRALGAAPDSAFQGWMLAVSAMNFGSAYLLFRRGVGFPAAAAAAGAFLMAFGAPRINQLGHQQLVPVIYCAATLFAVIRIFSRPGPSRSMRWVWWQLVALGLAAQLYAGFYNGWFLALGLGLSGAWAVALPKLRGPFLRAVWRDALPITAACAVGAASLGPFLTHYLAAARELGARDPTGVRWSILQPWSWLDVGPYHWLWGRSAGLALFRELPMEVEHRVGLGLVTPAVCIAGWLIGRNRPLVRIASLVALALALLATYLPTLWIADLGVAIAMVIATRFFHDRSRPMPAMIVLGALIFLATFERFPSGRVVSLILFTMALCLTEAFRVRRRPLGRSSRRCA